MEIRKTTLYDLDEVMTIYKKARQLRPDVIVTDFEIYATMVAKLRGIPLISLDNIHMITQTKIDYPKNHLAEMLKAKGVIKTYVIKPKVHILTSFFYPRIKPRTGALFAAKGWLLL